MIYNNSVIGGMIINCNHTIITEGTCGLLTFKLLKYYNTPYKAAHALGIRKEWVLQQGDNIGIVYHTIE